MEPLPWQGNVASLERARRCSKKLIIVFQDRCVAWSMRWSRVNPTHGATETHIAYKETVSEFAVSAAASLPWNSVSNNLNRIGVFDPRARRAMMTQSTLLSLVLLKRENGGDSMRTFTIKGDGVIDYEWSATMTQALMEGLPEACNLTSLIIEHYFSVENDGTSPPADLLSLLAAHPNLRKVALSLAFIVNICHHDHFWHGATDHWGDAIAYWIGKMAVRMEAVSLGIQGYDKNDALKIFMEALCRNVDPERALQLNLLMHADSFLTVGLMWAAWEPLFLAFKNVADTLPRLELRFFFVYPKRYLHATARDQLTTLEPRVRLLTLGDQREFFSDDL